MPCPTCDKTLHCLGVLEGRTHYHCPVCGTHRMKTGDHVHDTVPKLVERCREFERSIVNFESAAGLEGEWKRLGIEEAINTPENRNL